MPDWRPTRDVGWGVEVAQDGLRTEGFVRLLAASVDVAAANGSSTVDVIDVIDALVRQPGLDGGAFLATSGVDVAGAPERLALARAARPPVGVRTGVVRPVLGPEVKKLVTTAVELCRASRSDAVGTEHVAAAILLLPPKAGAPLGAPPARQHEVVRNLRAFIAGRAQAGPSYEVLARAIEQAEEASQAGFVLAAVAGLDQVLPMVSGAGTPELAAEAALVRAGAAASVDASAFEQACGWAHHVVSAAAVPRLTERYLVVVGNEAVERGDLAVARASSEDLQARPRGQGADDVDLLASRVHLLDGDLVAARRRSALPTDRRAERDQPGPTARRLVQRAVIAQWVGELMTAAELAGHALTLAHRAGAPMGVLLGAGRVLAHAGSPQAWAPLDRAMRIAHDNGAWRCWAAAQLGLCVLAARTQPTPASDHGLAQAAAPLEQLGLVPALLDARLEQAGLAAFGGRLDDAAHYLGDADARARAMGSTGWIERVARVRAELGIR